MPTIAHDLMQEVVTRLVRTPSVIADASNVRRDHRTHVMREQAPAIHVVDGDDAPTGKFQRGCVERSKSFTVALFVRDDQGFTAADPIVLTILARLNGLALAYSRKARIALGKIRFDNEIADGDALRVEIELTFVYNAPEWSLDREA